MREEDRQSKTPDITAERYKCLDGYIETVDVGTSLESRDAIRRNHQSHAGLIKETPRRPAPKRSVRGRVEIRR
jgi:hypothetical protein